MAAFASPVLFADQEALLPDQAFVVAGFELALADSTDPLSTGLVRLVGDLAGSNSDRLVKIWVDAVGWAERFTAMATETSPIPESGWTEILDDVTIGRYGLAKGQSWQSMILSRPGRATLEIVASMVVSSLLATIRRLVAVRASTISTVIGTSGLALTVDDVLALSAAMRETTGMVGSGRRIKWMAHPHQLTQVLNSMRNDPLYSGQAAAFEKALSDLNNGEITWFGMDIVQSYDVVSDGTDYLGGAWVEGAMGLAVVGTQAIKTADPEATMYVPELGLIISWRSNGNTAVTAFDANAWIGVDLVSESLLPARRVRSTIS